MDCFSCFFVTWFFEKGKHVFLVSLYARLVEWVNIKDITADTASLFKEIDDFTKVILAKFRQSNVDIWHTAVNVSDNSTKFCHFVNFVDTLVCDIVQTIKVCLVRRDANFVLLLSNRDNSFEDSSFAFLNPLTH